MVNAKVIFIDSTVADYQTLVSGALKDSEVIILNPEQNGIAQITDYLRKNAPVDSIHIVSHGSLATLYLGNTTLSLNNLNNYQEHLSKWSVKAIYLYGCNVAVGDAGEEFVTKLHEITGASIAASKTLTGNGNLGGDWNLAVTRGKITSHEAFSPEARQAYAGVLTTYTVNTLQDENNGINVGQVSLREAINAANANTGADTIQFNSALNNTITTLILGQLEITDHLTIKANSAIPVGISGNNNNRVFFVSDGTGKQINVTFDGLKIINGRASGGGIYNRENTTVRNSIISGNEGTWGGGIYNEDNGQITVIKSTISGNTASQRGGGIYSWNSAVTTVIDSTIAGNSARYGGGFLNASNTKASKIVNSTISGNSANRGGGISNYSNLTIINTTLSGNTANERGGGLSNGSQVSIFNSTITRNKAPDGKGAGIASNGSNTAIITQIANTIVSGNSDTDVDYLYGSNSTFVSIGNNLIGTGNAIGDFVQPGDQTGVTNPRLGALTNNGGSTLTHALLNGSPAINAGSNIALPVDTLDLDGDSNTNERISIDQTGDDRIQDGIVDIGAVESSFQGESPPQLKILDATVKEGNSGTSFAVFPIQLSKAFNKPITLKYSTINGTATSPTDFVGATNQTLVIPANQINPSLSIPIKGDVNIEPDETFTVRILSATNATLNDGVGIGKIVNDDTVSVSLDKNLTLSEGNFGTKTANFVLRLSKPSAIPVRVAFNTLNGTATNGTDFFGVNQVINFVPNQTTATVKVPIRGDKTFEPNESFSVRISNPVNATIGKNLVTTTITNDDLKPKISISDAKIGEGNSGNRNILFNIKLTNPSSQYVSAFYSTINGSAKSPLDYNAKSGQITFAPGQVTKPLYVQARGDKLKEGNEVFYVQLSGLKNANPLDLKATGTILNDDFQTLALVGSAESFTLGEETTKSTKQITGDDSLISFGGSTPTQRVILDGITQPDLFAGVNPTLNTSII